MKIATLAIITRRNQILLGRKKEGAEIGGGTLNGPGGKMESSDATILDCLIRETLEEFEIVLDPAKMEKCAVITFYAAGEPSFEVHVYRTSYFSGEPRETTSTMIPEWHDFDCIPFELMLEADPHWLPQIIGGKKFNANVYYREKAKGFLKIEFLPFTN